MIARAHIALLLAGLLASAPLAAIEIRLTDEERTSCDAEGGCVVVTRQFLRQVRDIGKAEGLATCKATT